MKSCRGRHREIIQELGNLEKTSCTSIHIARTLQLNRPYTCMIALLYCGVFEEWFLEFLNIVPMSWLVFSGLFYPWRGQKHTKLLTFASTDRRGSRYKILPMWMYWGQPFRAGKHVDLADTEWGPFGAHHHGIGWFSDARLFDGLLLHQRREVFKIPNIHENPANVLRSWGCHVKAEQERWKWHDAHRDIFGLHGDDPIQ